MAAVISPADSSSSSVPAPFVLSLTGPAASQFPSSSSEDLLPALLPHQQQYFYFLEGYNLSASLPLALNASVTPAGESLPPASNERLVQVLVLAVIFIAIVVGNVPVVITILFGRLGRTRMYYFLLHLCFADLITGLFNVIPQLAWELTRHFHGGNVLCKTVKFLQILGPYLSSYTLTAMSIDRFLAICHPLTNNHLSLFRAKQSIAIAWFLSLLFCVPQALIFSYIVISAESGLMECWGTFPFQPWGERLYVTWYAVSVFIIPFFIIFYTHFRICCELWRSSQERRCTQKGDRRKSHASTGTASSAKAPKNVTNMEPAIEDHIMTSESLNDKNNQHSLLLEIPPIEDGSSPPAQTTHQSMLKQASRRRSSKNVEFVHIQKIEGSELIHADEQRSGQSPVRAHQENVSQNMSRGMSQDEEHLRAKIKSVKLTVIVILCYVFCSLPFIIVQLWANWYPGAQESSYWTGLFPRRHSQIRFPASVPEYCHMILISARTCQAVDAPLVLQKCGRVIR